MSKNSKPAPVRVTKSDASAAAKRLVKIAAADFSKYLTHQQALVAVAKILGYRNQESMAANYLSEINVSSVDPVATSTKSSPFASVDSPRDIRLLTAWRMIELCEEIDPKAIFSDLCSDVEQTFHASQVAATLITEITDSLRDRNKFTLEIVKQLAYGDLVPSTMVKFVTSDAQLLKEAALLLIDSARPLAKKYWNLRPECDIHDSEAAFLSDLPYYARELQDSSSAQITPLKDNIFQRLSFEACFLAVLHASRVTPDAPRVEDFALKSATRTLATALSKYPILTEQVILGANKFNPDNLPPEEIAAATLIDENWPLRQKLWDDWMNFTRYRIENRAN